MFSWTHAQDYVHNRSRFWPPDPICTLLCMLGNADMRFPVESQLPDHYCCCKCWSNTRIEPKMSPSVSKQRKSKEEWLLKPASISLSARMLKTRANYWYFDLYSVDLCSFSQSMNNQPTDRSVWQLSRSHYFFVTESRNHQRCLTVLQTSLVCLNKCPQMSKPYTKVNLVRILSLLELDTGLVMD